MIGALLESSYLTIITCVLILFGSVSLFTWLRKGDRSEAVKRLMSFRQKDNATHTNGEAETNGVDESNLKIGVLFGTQTGTAEGFAKALKTELTHKFGQLCSVQAQNLDEISRTDDGFQAALQSFRIVIFLVATYGDGEPTDDAQRFFKWLSATVADNEDDHPLLKGLSFAVFGLGNRQYEHFNKMGKDVNKHMAALGASRIVDVGLGDDEICIEDDFDAWKSKMLHELPALLHENDPGYVVGEGEGEGGEEGEAEEEEEVAVGYEVEVMGEREGVSEEEYWLELERQGWHTHTVERAAVSEIRELQASDSERSTLHVEVDVSKCKGIKYEVGDHAALFAANNDDDVSKTAQCLGLSLSDVLSFQLPSSDVSLPPPPPSPCTVRTVLSFFADLHSSPRKPSLLALSQHASDPKEAAKLRHLASAKGRAEYRDFILSGHRGVLDLLASFPSARPPIGLFLARIAPRLQPRFYSISSCPRFAPDRLHITCAVVVDTTPAGRLHHGVCSTHLKRLSSLPSPPPLPLFIRSSTFRLPSDPSLPIVLVGPGTGIAPFRAFLQHRQWLINRGTELGPALLFFGCRRPNEDFLYESELQQFLSSGALSSLHVAFSRAGPTKVYVQHHLAEQGDRVWQLMSERGHLYVCGDAKAMARDVHSALITIAQKQGGLTTEAAIALMDTWHHEGRYLRDVW